MALSGLKEAMSSVRYIFASNPAIIYDQLGLLQAKLEPTTLDDAHAFLVKFPKHFRLQRDQVCSLSRGHPAHLRGPHSKGSLIERSIQAMDEREAR